MVVEQILKTTGYSFAMAENGSRAVALAKALAPRLILMDVSMPEMNGLEATAAIRRAERVAATRTDADQADADQAEASRAGGPARRVPIIGLTAHALKGDEAMCLSAGMDAYMAKPISPDRLTALIAEHLNPNPTAQSAA